MSRLEQEMKELEVSIEEAQKAVDMGETLRRLMNNPDWISLIENDYLREEAVRLTHLLGHPDALLDSKQRFIERDLQGIAAFKRFLHTKLTLAQISSDQIIAHKDELDELRQMEVDGDDYEGDDA